MDPRIYTDNFGWVTLGRHLASGGQACTHLVDAAGRRCVCKLFHDGEVHPHLSFILQLLHSAQTQVPGLVPLLGPTRPFPGAPPHGYVMAFVPGRSLEDTELGEGAPVLRRVRLARGILETLCGLEDQRLFFCDCHEGNWILPDGADRAVAIDLDAVTVEKAMWPDGTVAPRQFHRMTLAYAAPEVASGAAAQDGPFTLAWSGAILAYRCLKDFHPACVASSAGVPLDAEDSLQAGLFGRFDAAALRAACRLPLDRGVPWGEIPEVPRWLFTQTFTTGRIYPTARPRCRDYLDALLAWECDLADGGPSRAWRWGTTLAAVGVCVAAAIYGLASWAGPPQQQQKAPLKPMQSLWK